jgi:hypothetical protein
LGLNAKDPSVPVGAKLIGTAFRLPLPRFAHGSPHFSSCLRLPREVPFTYITCALVGGEPGPPFPPRPADVWRVFLPVKGVSMLRNAFRWSGLLLLLCVFVLPSLAQDVKKKDAKKTDVKKKDAKDDDGDEPKKGDKKKGDTKKEEDEDALVPLPGYTECKLVKAEGGKLTVTVKRRVFEGGKPQIKDVNVDLELADKVMVRVEKPPFAFDDKGQVKKYTKDELDAMKGENKKEFGYTAEIDILKGGHILRVFMGRPKSAPKTDPPQIIKIYVAGNGDLPQ